MRGASNSGRSATAWMILAGCAIVALLGQALLIPIDADVSWLITVSEKMLGGARLYIDVFEVNPPASVWLYLPQVAVAQALGQRPEAVVAAIATALALLSSALTLRLALTLDDPPPTLPMAAALGFVTLILPGGLFAQREHYALLLGLPLCAQLARMAQGKGAETIQSAATGVAGGFLLVIKPHFALAVALPALFALWRSRTLHPFAIAAVAGALVLALYGWAIWRFAPAYIAQLPMLAELYIPMRERWGRLLYGPVILFPAALTLLLAWLRRRPLAPLAVTLSLAALGFTIAALIQGKGYWNHALPAVGLLIIAVTVAAFDGAVVAERRRLTLFGLAALGIGSTAATARIAPPPGLVEQLRAVAPANPRMLTLGTELATGHSAVRLVDGQWSGTRAALFTAAGARYRIGGSQEGASQNLRRWYRDDLDILAADIDRTAPDVVLVETDDKSWLFDDPAIRGAMARYRPAARAGDIEIWLRRT